MAHLRMADWLAPELEGRDLDVVGVVVEPAGGRASARCASSSRSSRRRASALPQEAAAVLVSQPVDRGRRRRCSSEPVHPGERWLFTRAAAPAARPRQSARLRLRGVAARARHRRDRLRAAAGRAASRLGSRNSFFDRIEKAREAVRDRFQARARRDAGRRHPGRARGRRPARDLRRGMAALQPHRRHAPDEHLGAARHAGLGARGVAGRVRLAARAGARRCACRRARPRPRRRSPPRSATRCSPASRCRRSARSTW